jgi:hypothetical protein
MCGIITMKYTSWYLQLLYPLIENSLSVASFLSCRLGWNHPFNKSCEAAGFQKPFYQK